MCMDYKTFSSYIEDNIEDYLDRAAVVSIQVLPDIKNNGVVEETLVIRTKDNPQCPVICLTPYYDAYTKGTDKACILAEIADDYFKGVYQPYTVPLGHLMDFEAVREDIFIRAVNYERNKDMLAICPHVRKMDLALTFRVRFYQGSDGLSSLLVDYRMMGHWDISEEFLYEYAMKNTTAKFPPVIESSEDIYTGLMLDLVAQQAQKSGHTREAARILKEDMKKSLRVIDRRSKERPLYVITNHIHLNGATAAFYPGVLKSFSESLCRGGMDFYLLPCSIHEMMFVPYESDPQTAEAYKRIVASGNQEVVRPEEILSDNVYRYTFKTDEISISI